MRSLRHIVEEAKRMGPLSVLTVDIVVKAKFTDSFSLVSTDPSYLKDGTAVSFMNEVFVWFQGNWYEGSDHPRNPNLNLSPSKKEKSGPGYHVKSIKKHDFGTVEKIFEEYEELIDAKAQGVKIMELVELSDIVGAIEGYVEKAHPGITLADLVEMSSVTKRAFLNGHRS